MKSITGRVLSRLGLTAVLLIAAGLRMVGLDGVSPPGLAHDEVANWLIDRSILAGHHAVYFTDAYGHEAGFHYWQTLFVWLTGDHALALRLPAAYAGLLLVAVTYTLNARLFNRRVGLLSAAFTAVLFMPVFYSRLGLRAMTLPVCAGLSFYFWWGGWRSGRRRPFVWAGVWSGAAMYTYMAARALPIFYLLLVVGLALTHRSRLRALWPKVAGFAAVYAAVSAPLVWFLATTPTADVRVAEVDAPLRALLAGDVGPVLNNAVALLLSFGWTPDPLWRQGVPAEPIFAPLAAVLFYLGLGLLLWRRRDAAHLSTTLWISAAVIPSLVTINAPSTIRIILILPFLSTPIALLIHKIGRLSTVIPTLSTKLGKNLWITVLTIIILLLGGARTADLTFRVWPQNEEVRFVWQAAFAQIGRFADAHPQVKAAAVAGWTPDTMDAPTLELETGRTDIEWRHFGTVGLVETAVVPNLSTSPVHIFRPAALPLHWAVAERLAVPAQERDEMVVYALTEWAWPIQRPADILLTDGQGAAVRFLGHDLLATPDLDRVEMVTFWRVEGESDRPWRTFLHLVDANTDAVLSQHDGLDAPARFWREGDLLIQYHNLVQHNVPYHLRLGLYDARPPYVRMSTADGADFIRLSP